MLHNEARRLLVQAYEQTHDAQTVAKCFQVSTSTVYRLSVQMKKTGSVELQTSQRGRKPALTEEDLQGIDQLTRQSGSVFDVMAAREAWSEMITQCEADKLVFLDESGVNTDLSRCYGRAIGGERSVDKTPLNTPANTTILSSIRRNGETAYTIYSGGTTREKFLDHLKNTLIPTLHEGDIVIMDNMRTHHVKEVQTLLQKDGMKLWYLPAYSPDLNTIETMWSKIMAILRKLKIRLLPQLPHGIAEAFSRIRPSDCAGWFSAAGIPC